MEYGNAIQVRDCRIVEYLQSEAHILDDFFFRVDAAMDDFLCRCYNVHRRRPKNPAVRKQRWIVLPDLICQKFIKKGADILAGIERQGVSADDFDIFVYDSSQSEPNPLIWRCDKSGTYFLPCTVYPFNVVAGFYFVYQTGIDELFYTNAGDAAEYMLKVVENGHDLFLQHGCIFGIAIKNLMLNFTPVLMDGHRKMPGKGIPEADLVFLLPVLRALVEYGC